VESSRLSAIGHRDTGAIRPRRCAPARQHRRPRTPAPLPTALPPGQSAEIRSRERQFLRPGERGKKMPGVNNQPAPCGRVENQNNCDSTHQHHGQPRTPTRWTNLQPGPIPRRPASRPRRGQPLLAESVGLPVKPETHGRITQQQSEETKTSMTCSTNGAHESLASPSAARPANARAKKSTESPLRTLRRRETCRPQPSMQVRTHSLTRLRACFQPRSWRPLQATSWLLPNPQGLIRNSNPSVPMS